MKKVKSTTFTFQNTFNSNETSKTDSNSTLKSWGSSSFTEQYYSPDDHYKTIKFVGSTGWSVGGGQSRDTTPATSPRTRNKSFEGSSYTDLSRFFLYDSFSRSNSRSSSICNFDELISSVEIIREPTPHISASKEHLAELKAPSAAIAIPKPATTRRRKIIAS